MAGKKKKTPAAAIYTPGPNIKEKLATLKDAIVNRPPFCSGTVPIAASDLLLFYGKPSQNDTTGGFLGRGLDLTKATGDELQLLVNVCDQATFGMNHEDVLDLSYRSAWKLDPAHFATKLNIVHAGLMDSIRYNLLTGEQGKETFFAELYKLNVYGKGSFFKSHKDTPRGEKMFGSLVVVLPTAHEGGTLVIRHGDEEWKIESDAVTPSSITYAAFFGDVEHEVTEVKSGYRLTLTYNLYFGESRDSQAITSTPASTAPAFFTSLPPNATSFQSKLAELLADETFLPKGGYIGFGLFHEYPFASNPNLKQLTDVLKGNDAALMQACSALNLNCVIQVCYEGADDDGRSLVALCDHVPDLEDVCLDMEIWQYLKDEEGALIVNADHDDTSADEEGNIDLKTRNYKSSRFYTEPPQPVDVYVHWVTKQTSYNAFKAHVVAYGNEPSSSHEYGKVCLIVKVGPSGRRDKKPQWPSKTRSK